MDPIKEWFRSLLHDAGGWLLSLIAPYRSAIGGLLLLLFILWMVNNLIDGPKGRPRGDGRR